MSLLLASGDVVSHLVDSHIAGPWFTQHHVLLMMVAATMIVGFRLVAVRARTGTPGGFPSLVEVALVWVRDQIVYPWLGEDRGRRYLPYLWTLFFFILFSVITRGARFYLLAFLLNRYGPRARAIIERKTIRAPFRARVGLADVHIGQYLNEGTELTTLQGVDTAAHVDFTVAQSVAAKLEVGQQVAVSAAGAPARLSASIVAIDARVDPLTRNALVRARIPEGAPAPGASVRIEVPVGPPASAVARRTIASGRRIDGPFTRRGSRPPSSSRRGRARGARGRRRRGA